MKVAIINSFGFESGGMTTLCIYYSKLGLDVYIKDIVRPLKYKTFGFNVGIYKEDSELLEISKKYDRLIFLPPAYKSEYKTGKYEKAFFPIFNIRKNNTSVQLCYLYCSRDSDDFINYLMPTLINNNFEFDYYFSISTELQGVKDNIICFDINAFCFEDKNIVSFEDRENIVLTAGRVEGFKGVTKYFNSFVLDDEFTYVHEGAGYSFTANGISVPPQLLSMKTSETAVFKNYGDAPESGKLNIYPTYKLEDIYSRWSKYLAGVCCIMGTKNMCVQSSSLLHCDVWQVNDKAENTLVKKQANLWGVGGLEYANLEMIQIGLPVLFSRGYSRVIQFKDDRLIYNSFSEIPQKLKTLKNKELYTSCIKEQYEFFKDRQFKINKNILKIFKEYTL